MGAARIGLSYTQLKLTLQTVREQATKRDMFLVLQDVPSSRRLLHIQWCEVVQGPAVASHGAECLVQPHRSRLY